MDGGSSTNQGDTGPMTIDVSLETGQVIENEPHQQQSIAMETDNSQVNQQGGSHQPYSDLQALVEATIAGSQQPQEMSQQDEQINHLQQQQQQQQQQHQEQHSGEHTVMQFTHQGELQNATLQQSPIAQSSELQADTELDGQPETPGGASAALFRLAAQASESQQATVKNEGSGDKAAAASAGGEESSVFAYIPKSGPSGEPDWSQVIRIDKDVLNEVLARQAKRTEGGTASGSDSGEKKQKKKKKKKKKSKDPFQGIKNIWLSPQPIGEFTCDTCGRICQTPRGLQRHIKRRHLSERPFKCADCPWAFAIMSELKAHEKTHSKERPFQCKECSQCFKRSGDLKRHESSHSEERPHKCPVCEMSFKRSQNLRQHMILHSDIKSYVCDFCKKAFARKDYLEMHTRTHTGDEDQKPKPFKCEFCDKTFLYKRYMLQHLPAHTGEKPFLCDLCGKAFGYKSGLRVHRKTHTGVGAVYCDICNKVFGDSCRMREHRVIHSGEKPFMCQLCGNRFSHRSGLRLHLKTLHKGSKHPKEEVIATTGVEEENTVVIQSQDQTTIHQSPYGAVEQQVIVSGPSSSLDMQQHQPANIQYVQHIQEVHPPTTTAIINAIQGLNPHTTAIQTLDPHTGTTTIQVIEAQAVAEDDVNGPTTIQVPVSKMNHPEDITAVAEIVLQLHT